jgi:hypothetical protein
MFPDFTLKDDNSPPDPGRKFRPEEEKRLELLLSRRLSQEEHLRLEVLLLERIKQHKPELDEMLKVMSDHWTYEDHFYRYYHSSFKVYRTQDTTGQAVKLLRELLPERELNLTFEDIIREGTGQEFEIEHNADWDQRTRPMLEAFCHAKFMVEMAVRYAELAKPPQPMPSGWAALLYLYDLR